MSWWDDGSQYRGLAGLFPLQRADIFFLEFKNESQVEMKRINNFSLSLFYWKYGYCCS